MADDSWANWNPTTNPSVRGNEAYQARRALSRGLSADPMSPGSAAPARSFPGRQAPSTVSRNGAIPGPSAPGARRPLPEQSFPGPGRGGPSRNAGGWQRSAPVGHIDHGWASKTGHEDPIAKPVMVGDIESASNAPLTETQRHDDMQNRRSGRDELQDRTKRRLDDERHHLDSHKSSSRASPRARSRDRDSVKDRERDRKRPRRDDDSERPRARRRSRSRSRSREREREKDSRRDDRRSSRRDDERRERRRDDRDRDRTGDRRSRSPRRSRDDRPQGSSSQRVSREEDSRRSQRSRQGSPGREDPTSTQANVDDAKKDRTTETREKANTRETSADDYVVIVSGVHGDTAAVDMKTVIEGFAKPTYCKRLQGANTSDGTASFEAGFSDQESAQTVVKQLDGIVADGCKIKAALLSKSVKQEEQDSPRPTSPGLKLKGFASASNQDASLLSRLGAPIKATLAKTNGAAKANGGTSSNMPSAMLQPYEDLLKRAGVDSMDKLKKLVRSGSVKEYIEMLCKEFPDEELLQGLTARWALKERLEDWLGEKRPLEMEWETEKQQVDENHDIELE